MTSRNLIQLVRPQSLDHIRKLFPNLLITKADKSLLILATPVVKTYSPNSEVAIGRSFIAVRKLADNVIPFPRPTLETMMILHPGHFAKILDFEAWKERMVKKDNGAPESPNLEELKKLHPAEKKLLLMRRLLTEDIPDEVIEEMYRMLTEKEKDPSA